MGAEHVAGDAEQPWPGIPGYLVETSPGNQEDLVDKIIHEAGLRPATNVSGDGRILSPEQSLKTSRPAIALGWVTHIPLVAGEHPSVTRFVTIYGALVPTPSTAGADRSAR